MWNRESPVSVVSLQDGFIIMGKSSEDSLLDQKCRFGIGRFTPPFFGLPVLPSQTTSPLGSGQLQSGSRSNDPETSLLIRCLHVIEAFLEYKIYVRHLRRMSNRWLFSANSLQRVYNYRRCEGDDRRCQQKFPSWGANGGLAQKTGAGLGSART